MKRERYYLDLFSGIGGFALGAYWAGLRFDKHYFSEIEPYAIELYQKRFPEAEALGDIKNVCYSKLPRGEYLVTGGFPCQPHSISGKRQAENDKRDLWAECKRMLCELQPGMALFENVGGLFTSPGKERKGEYFNRLLSDIHESGYAAEWQVISAADVGAPHKRERVWIIAYPNSKRLPRGQNNTGRIESWSKVKQQLQGFLPPDFGLDISKLQTYRDNNGIPSRVDRFECLGNAVIPQCPEIVFSLPAFDLFREHDPNP